MHWFNVWQGFRASCCNVVASWHRGRRTEKNSLRMLHHLQSLCQKKMVLHVMINSIILNRVYTRQLPRTELRANWCLARECQLSHCRNTVTGVQWVYFLYRQVMHQVQQDYIWEEESFEYKLNVNKYIIKERWSLYIKSCLFKKIKNKHEEEWPQIDQKN